jgi:hypothetical protein
MMRRCNDGERKRRRRFCRDTRKTSSRGKCGGQREARTAAPDEEEDEDERKKAEEERIAREERKKAKAKQKAQTRAMRAGMLDKKKR